MLVPGPEVEEAGEAKDRDLDAPFHRSAEPLLYRLEKAGASRISSSAVEGQAAFLTGEGARQQGEE